MKVNELFSQLVWPAAAGNVAWSAAYMAVNETKYDSNFFARLALLVLLAIYLALEWRMSANATPRCWAIAFDSFLVTGVAVFAIATSLDKSWLKEGLIGVLLIAVVGHIFRVWRPLAKSVRWQYFAALAACSAIGIAIILVFQCVHATPWALPIAVFVVIALWLTAKALKLGLS